MPKQALVPSRLSCKAPGAATHLILENNVESVDDTGNVTWRRQDGLVGCAEGTGPGSGPKLTKDGQADVDAEVSTAATLEKDTDGREDDGKEDLL